LAREGALVAVNDTGLRTGADAASVVAEITGAGGTATASTASATFGGADQIIQTAVDSFGGADNLVKNASASERSLGVHRRAVELHRRSQCLRILRHHQGGGQ
jgi:NAD(P)-dependent dehydrogenase (short-subunit alcohol dehydrogenase family)